MLDRRRLLTSVAALAGAAALAGHRAAASNMNITLTSHFQVTRFIDADTVELIDGNARQVLKRGEVFDGCTLVEIVAGDFVVMEDFETVTGDMMIVDTAGVRYRLGKTAESTAIDGQPALPGQTQAGDRLGADVLARPGDPDYATVAAVLPPIRHVSGDIYSFVGTPDGMIGFTREGGSPRFDPAVMAPSIDTARQAGQVLGGLLGGYLPCLRFVYPDSDGAWTELLAFAPLPEAGASPDQPVSYRVARVEGGRLAWAKHVDSRQPSSQSGDATGFYSGLAAVKAGWDQRLAPGMKLDIAETRVADMARHSLIRTMIAGAESAGPEVAEAMGNWGLGAMPALAAEEAAPSATCLGMPVDPAGQIAGDLFAGYGHDLIAADRIEEALLLLYGAMAHLCTRGQGMAVATRAPFGDEAAPYSPVSQAAIALLVRWLVVFEDPEAKTLWLGKGMPEAWFADTRLNFIDDAPTRWGRVSFATDSRIDKEHRIAAKVILPDGGTGALTKLRLRTGRPIRGVTVGDRSWKNFEPETGTITLPAGMGGTILIEARY